MPDAPRDRAAEAETDEPSREAVEKAIDALVEEQRVDCLWWTRPDYYPRTDPERVRVLEGIQAGAGLAAFKRAGRLKEWLSRHSSDESASS